MRTSKPIMKEQFTQLLKKLGKEQGFEKGQWNIDYYSLGGGYIIVEYMENGGEHHPLMNERLKLREMQVAIEMALAVINHK